MQDFTTTSRIMILFANTYDMLDERQQQRTGCSIHYLFFGENGEQIATQTEYDVNKPVGYQRAKCSIDMALRAKIPFAPAIYDGEFMMTVGSDGKPVLKLKDVSFVSMVDISPRMDPSVMVPGMTIPPVVAEAAREAVAAAEPNADKHSGRK